MFVLITAHASKSPFELPPMSIPDVLMTPVVNLWRTYNGFVANIDTLNGPVFFLGTLKSWHQITKDVLYVTVSLIGDGIAVWLGVPKFTLSALKTHRFTDAGSSGVTITMSSSFLLSYSSLVPVSCQL
jgi:hypothetical protein